MPYSLINIPYEIQEEIVKSCYWTDPQSLIEFCKAYEFLRPVAINYLKVLEKSRTGLHLHDHWTRWQLENPRNIEYAEHVVFCTLTPASPEEPSFKKLKLHKDLAIENNSNNSSVTTRKATTAKKTSASSKRR
jgi:hypothetical protein